VIKKDKIMKLIKLYIHNYKSFYDTTIELDKLNIVVGENNSGKSNLIDVLEFIDIAMSKDIERAISDKGGYDKIKNYSAVGEEKVVVRATFKKKDNTSKVILLSKIPYEGILQGEGEFTYSFSFAKNYTIFSVNVNMLFVGTTNTQLIKENFEKKYDNITSQNMDIEKINFTIANKDNFTDKKNNPKKLFIPTSCNRKFILEHLHGILSDIGLLSNSELKIEKYNPFSTRYISTYYFDTNSIRLKSHQNSEVTLKKDGSNLGKNIYNFLRGLPEFDIVSNSLITTVNEIDGIEIYKVAGSNIIAFKEGDKEISIDTVSDGTINFLATMVALNQPIDDSFMLVFEEPERHLHFKVVNYLLDSFRHHDKQILITSHSTEMLKYADLNEVIFIYRDSDGDTQTIRADKIPNLKEKMEYMTYERSMTLDEIIDNGLLGNLE
jgi:predicted ATPase